MKKTLSIVMYVFMSLVPVNAQQTNQLFVEEGKTWHTMSLHPATEHSEKTIKDFKGRWCWGIPHDYIIEGDTILGESSYMKLQEIGHGFICGLRQDDNHVYKRDCKEEKEYLIYDFNLSPGDSYVFRNETKMRVENVDTICIDGVSRKRLMIWMDDDNYRIEDGLVDIWIEGIGSIVGSPCFPTLWSATGNQSILLQCRVGSMSLFSNEDYQASTINQKCFSAEDNHKATLHDLQGRRVTNQPRRGVYIRDGWKVVVK